MIDESRASCSCEELKARLDRLEELLRIINTDLDSRVMELEGERSSRATDELRQRMDKLRAAIDERE